MLSHEELKLRPSSPDALQLSHRDTKVIHIDITAYC